ncbi:DNA lesion error-prone repair protein ImuA [Pseudoxanthomonas broegbernensis]|uniref:DNA lesion error-prone repair protein ImuA n=1 Tax=Pseudoxanthomonas broegbernensis TaxID=83619 RepID=A0A7V8K8C9_9GAMM|nr:translesion DNA synthesis-associated protein ImuA [Pseudoxanthomonas broegbernensis]KAF1687981.1 DNA lesion error-prone repair protein ImuA [Pseudoxanthomonas broegbernensis]MBB6064996.1 cell division inhibitor SulA [Pseudoxanthomonas broegbernensis]
MGQVVTLHELVAAQRVWHGRSARPLDQGVATGFTALDEALPLGGWPKGALTELLLPADGLGELALLLPTFARLTQAGQRVVLVAPPYIPYAPAWRAGGVRLPYLDIIEAEPKQALWAYEQCLRSGSCTAVVGWPRKADHHALRRLQVAADTGQALGFALRDRRHAEQASPAALRLELGHDRQVRIRKCRGGNPPARSFALLQ